jgi:putative Mn2+ efflux pump MntP
MLITLAVATSIDALAVGFSFAFLEADITVAVAFIGITAFMVTALGFTVGKKVGRFAGKKAEIIGGLILIAIGIRVLLSHLF